MVTVHRFSFENKRVGGGVARPLVGASADLIRALRRAVDAEVGTDASFAARESAALAVANGATKLFLRDELLAIKDRDGLEVEVDGRIYRRHQPRGVPPLGRPSAGASEPGSHAEIGSAERWHM